MLCCWDASSTELNSTQIDKFPFTVIILAKIMRKGNKFLCELEKVLQIGVLLLEAKVQSQDCVVRTACRELPE